MAEITEKLIATPDTGQAREETETLLAPFVDWVRTELVWYAGSFTVHLMALSLLLLLGPIVSRGGTDDAPNFQSKAIAEEPALEPHEHLPSIIPSGDDFPPPDTEQPPIRDVPLPQENTVEIKVSKPGTPGGGTPYGRERETGIGVGIGTLPIGPGPKMPGRPGISNPGLGTGTQPGNGGKDFGPRGNPDDHVPAKKIIPAVKAALAWLVNHQQLSEGNWSLQNYTQRCYGRPCSGQGMRDGRRGRDGDGRLAVPGRGADAQDAGALPRDRRAAIAWLMRAPAARRQPGQGRGADDVLPRPGDDRTVRGLRLDAATASRPGRAAGRQFHRRRPKQPTTAAGATTRAIRATLRWSAGN